MILTKKGYKPVAIAFIISAVFYLIEFEFFSLIAFLVAIFLVYIFKKSTRYIFENSTNILSPIDGKIIAIDKCDNKTKIYIQKTLLGDSTLRSPYEADCKIKRFQHGLHLNPNSYKANLLNEQIKVKLSPTNSEMQPLKIKLISGFFNPSIEPIEKQSVKQGESLGLFIHGMVVVSLKQCELQININDSVKSGQSVLAKI